MKKIHIAISTDKLEETINDYSLRLGAKPCSFTENMEYDNFLEDLKTQDAVIQGS